MRDDPRSRDHPIATRRVRRARAPRGDLSHSVPTGYEILMTVMNRLLPNFSHVHAIYSDHMLLEF